MELALAGDVTALRCVLSGWCRPAGKHRSAWTCRPLRRQRTCPRVLSFPGGGEVTPGEAEKLARLASEYAKAVVPTEIEERLRRMEEAVAAALGPG